LRTGPVVPFAELTWREQADVLRSFIQWERYPERAWDDEYTIRENIEAGKRPEQWLEGTSLHESFRLLADGKTPPPRAQWPEITQEDLANLVFEQDDPERSERDEDSPRDAFGMAGADGSRLKAEDGKLSLRDLRNGSQQQEKHGENEKSKSREIER
jgi:hypothetical protein